MEVAAVAALGGWLTQLLSIIQDLGDSYIQAGAAWEVYPLRVKVLIASQKDLVKSLGTYGFSEESLASFLRIVEEADTILQHEVAKLENRKRQRGSIWYSFRGTHLSASVNSSIETAEGACRRIREYLDGKQKTDNGVKAFAESQGPGLRIPPDPRYVPRFDLEEEIMSALYKTEQDGVTSVGAQQHSRVLLLWGASGYGKSTVAMEVSRKCERDQSIFTKVVFLECGPEVTIPAKKIDLLRKLGGGDFQSENQDVDSKLEIYLRNPRLLVVLDDLFEPELFLELHKLSASGLVPGAQYLITAQKEDKFSSFSPKSIPIRDLERSDAKKVLASHAGFEDKIIPKRWQHTANQIVDRIGTSPLMLTNLGVKIQRLGNQKRESWKQVSQDVFKYAQGDGTSLHMHGLTYSKQILRMMTSAFDRLDEEQKLLFALMAMWRGALISEYALRFLYIAAISQDGFGTSFVESIYELKTTGFVVERVEGVLSMHSSVKAFIWEYQKHDIEAVKKLLEDGPVEDASQSPTVEIGEKAWAQNSIRKAVVYLHIDTRSSKEAGRQDDDSSDPSVFTLLKARQAIIDVDIITTTADPLMQLLVPEANRDNEVTENSTGWTDELSLCRNQVLLVYVNEDRLHHDGISKLLASESSILPILTFLKNVCLLKDSFWKKSALGHTSSIPFSLLNILRDDSRVQHHAAVTETILKLSWRCKENAKAIWSTPGILRQLADSLAKNQDPPLEASAASTLAALAYWGNRTDDAVARIIFELPGLLHTLVDLLRKDEAPLVQTAAAHALAGLAYSTHGFYGLATESSTKGQFVPWDELLEGLTMSMTRDDVPSLQVFSANAVTNLLGERRNIRRTVNHLGLVDSLVKSLRKDQNPKLQAQSARAVCYMVTKCEDDTFRLLIAKWPGLLDGLGYSLLKPRNPSLQEAAAAVIASIACRMDNESLRTLVNHESLMGNLVKLLHECQSSGVQLQVALALAALLRGIEDNRMKAKIVNFPKLLEGLTGLLLKGNNTAIQIYAALSIHRIGSWDLHIDDEIRNQSRFLDNLEKLFGEAQNSDVQYNVNTLFQKLAIKRVIEDESGLLVVVAKSLLTAQSADIQMDILETIQMTFEVFDDVVSEQLSQALLNCPEVEDRLVELLGARQEQVQAGAALVLAFLVKFGGDSLRDRIATFPHVLEGLSESLVSPDRKETGFLALLLAQLAKTKDQGVLDKVCNSANLVENLATSLTESDDLKLQVCAAGALLNLAGGEEETWEIDLSIFTELLERLKEALLQDENAALRKRVVLALTSLPEGRLIDEFSIDALGKEEAVKENGGPNQNRGRLIRKWFRKFFPSLGNTKDKVPSVGENVVDIRVFLRLFITGLTTS